MEQPDLRPSILGYGFPAAKSTGPVYLLSASGIFRGTPDDL